MQLWPCELNILALVIFGHNFVVIIDILNLFWSATLFFMKGIVNALMDIDICLFVVSKLQDKRILL